jgi:hypothetical protein
LDAILEIEPPERSSAAGAARAVRLRMILGVYALAAVWAVAAYRFQINPDAVSYISVAREYIHGDFATAVNAYWSPLYSWLLVPLLIAGLPPLLAAQILGALIGLGTLAAAWRLAENLGLSGRGRNVACAALIPIVLYLAASAVTPDLLSTTLVLVYLAHVTRPDYPESRFSGVLAGTWGALGYLSKAYVMPFFLTHFLLTSALAFRSQRIARRPIARHALAGLLTFTLIAGAWCALLTHKYGRPMTGSAGAYNHAYNGPTHPDYPMHTLGFLPPSNHAAVSAWEDPTYHDMPAWSPFASRANLVHQLHLIARNLKETLGILQWYSILSIAIIAAACLCAAGTADPRPRRPVLLLVLAVAIYPLGYLLLHVEPRFLSQMAVILLLLGVFVIDAALADRLSPRRRRIALAVLCASFIFRPTYELIRDRGAGRNAWQRASQLRDLVPPGSRIASDAHWKDTLFIAFHRDLAYYGESRPNSSPADVEADLKRYHIQFFIVWNDPQRFPFTQTWPELSHGQAAGLKLYEVPTDTAAPAPAQAR